MQLPSFHAAGDGVACGRSSSLIKFSEDESPMRMAVWIAFLLVSNVLGVTAFRAAMTLPLDEAVLPGVLTVPLIGMTAFGLTRVLAAWQHRDDE